jgi:Niemann-Pick C1 protein
MSGLPQGPDFMKYLGHWLDSPTTDACPLGGKASYYNAIDLSEEKDSVLASHFRTYHTPLKQQSDYINAMTSAMRISEDLSKRTGGKVYPYSIFYVFFEQYGRIVRTSKEVIILTLAAVFVVSSILLGSWQTGGIMCMTVLMIIGNMTGGMAVWKVDLNAISLVNLVIGVGIGIEFCSHIVRAFTGANGGGLPKRHHLAQRDRDERITIAMSEVGSSVSLSLFFFFFFFFFFFHVSFSSVLLLQITFITFCFSVVDLLIRSLLSLGFCWNLFHQVHWDCSSGTNEIEITRGEKCPSPSSHQC